MHEKRKAFGGVPVNVLIDAVEGMKFMKTTEAVRFTNIIPGKRNSLVLKASMIVPAFDSRADKAALVAYIGNGGRRFADMVEGHINVKRAKLKEALDVMIHVFTLALINKHGSEVMLGSADSRFPGSSQSISEPRNNVLRRRSEVLGFGVMFKQPTKVLEQIFHIGVLHSDQSIKERHKGGRSKQKNPRQEKQSSYSKLSRKISALNNSEDSEIGNSLQGVREFEGPMLDTAGVHRKKSRVHSSIIGRGDAAPGVCVVQKSAAS